MRMILRTGISGALKGAWLALVALVSLLAPSGAFLDGLSPDAVQRVNTANPVCAPASLQISTAVDPGSRYLFGTLNTAGCNAGIEVAAGLRLAEMDIGWRSYEPAPGVFDDNYAASVKSTLQQFVAAGTKVVVDPGLVYPPDWALAFPDGRYVDQFGHPAPGIVNLTYSQSVRTAVAAYLARLVADLGPQNIWGIRIGSGGLNESSYPEEVAARDDNGYWAFDVSAMGGPDRPASIPASPLPGWKPGDRSWDSKPVTVDQVRQWYQWYLGAMVDGINWQIKLYDDLGVKGYKLVLMAGLGSRPSEYNGAIASYLDGHSDDNETMGRGAVWNLVIDQLAGSNIVVYVSSLADGSGQDDVCQPSDASVSLNDQAINGWSAARWISWNAARHALPTMGENPGRGSNPNPRYGMAMMEHAAQQMQGCGMMGLFWAHDFNLYDGVSGVSLADYSALIQRYRG